MVCVLVTEFLFPIIRATCFERLAVYMKPGSCEVPVIVRKHAVTVTMYQINDSSCLQVNMYVPATAETHHKNHHLSKLLVCLTLNRGCGNYVKCRANQSSRKLEDMASLHYNHGILV